MFTLNEKQNNILKEIISSKLKYVFISGSAGTGKSKLLEEIVNFYEENEILVVALSAIAARNVSGKTIHSVFKLNFQSENTKKIFLNYNVKILIIDEISMVSDKILDVIDNVLKNYFKNSLPFGGLSVICFGDLYQLEPIKTKNIKGEENNEKPVFFSKQWNIFKYRELTENMRQKEEDFIINLNKLREGDVSTINFFNNFVIQDIPEELQLDCLSLTSKKINSFFLNKKMFDIISNGKFVKHYILKEEEKKITKNKDYDYCYPYSQRDSIFQNNISLCRGVKIMFTVNDINKRFLNGEIAEVEEINDEWLIIKKKDLQEDFFYTIKLEKLSIMFFKKEFKKQYVDVVTGFPIQYAWSCTIHKMQGITVEKLIIEDTNMFANGQLYVALSRVRNSSGIYLKNKIEENNILYNNMVSKEYKRLKSLPLY